MTDTGADVFTLTPTEATARLDAIRPAAPAAATPAAEASVKLKGLTADKAWSEKFFAGDVAARREFAELTTAAANGDSTGEAIAGTAAAPGMIETTFGSDLNSRATVETVQLLREAGFTDATTEALFRGDKMNRQEVEMARRYQSMRHSDQSWVSRLLAGGWTEQRESMLLAAILSADVEEVG